MILTFSILGILSGILTLVNIVLYWKYKHVGNLVGFGLGCFCLLLSMNAVTFCIVFQKFM